MQQPLQLQAAASSLRAEMEELPWRKMHASRCSSSTGVQGGQGEAIMLFQPSLPLPCPVIPLNLLSLRELGTLL